LRNRQLIVEDSRATSELSKLTTWLRNVPESADIPVQTIVVRKKAGRPVLIRVLPIPPGARGPFLGARVLLTLSMLDPPPASQDLLVQIFDLTPAEAKVAAHVGNGATLDKVAQVSGVAISTVRNQLKAVFAKTDAHRQAELVVLTSRLQVPN
jgi:DNA-binding CsgD family transcriptional regulator